MRAPFRDGNRHIGKTGTTIIGDGTLRMLLVRDTKRVIPNLDFLDLWTGSGLFQLVDASEFLPEDFCDPFAKFEVFTDAVSKGDLFSALKFNFINMSKHIFIEENLNLPEINLLEQHPR